MFSNQTHTAHISELQLPPVDGADEGAILATMRYVNPDTLERYVVEQYANIQERVVLEKKLTIQQAKEKALAIFDAIGVAKASAGMLKTLIPQVISSTEKAQKNPPAFGFKRVWVTAEKEEERRLKERYREISEYATKALKLLLSECPPPMPEAVSIAFVFDLKKHEATLAPRVVLLWDKLKGDESEGDYTTTAFPLQEAQKHAASLLELVEANITDAFLEDLCTRAKLDTQETFDDFAAYRKAFTQNQ